MQNQEQAREDKKQRNKKQTRNKTNDKALLYAQRVFELLIKILNSNDVFKSGKHKKELYNFPFASR